MAEVNIKGYKCDRCAHEWTGRANTEAGGLIIPLVCPKCKSPYWNRGKPRKK